MIADSKTTGESDDSNKLIADSKTGEKDDSNKLELATRCVFPCNDIRLKKKLFTLLYIIFHFFLIF